MFIRTIFFLSLSCSMLLGSFARANDEKAPAASSPLIIRPPQLNYAALCHGDDPQRYTTEHIQSLLTQEKEGRFNGETYLALSHIYHYGLGDSFRDQEKALSYANNAASHPFTGRNQAKLHLSRLLFSYAKKGDADASTKLTRLLDELRRSHPAHAAFMAGELATIQGNPDAALLHYQQAAANHPKAALAVAKHYRALQNDKKADEMIALAQNLLLGEINQGQCGALLTLGEVFLNPALMPPQPTIGMAWLETALRTGYASAGVRLGRYYSAGEMVEKDEAAARTWWRQATELGSKHASYLLGMSYLTEAKAAAERIQQHAATKEAIAHLTQAATHNHLSSITTLIHLYEGEYGEEFRDDRKVTEWEKRALQAPHPPAYLLRKAGLAYRLGTEGKTSHYQKSLALLKQAAKEGDDNALQDIADSYRFGWGVAQTLEQSFAYTKKAAESGNAASAYHLAEHYHCGIGTEKDNNNALTWLNRAIAGGNLAAVFTWQSYNPEKGAVLTGGDVTSIYAYDRYIGGTDKEKSATRLRYLQQAAKQGSSKAMTLLALHARANGDEKKAQQLIQDAQTIGDNPSDSFLVLGTTALENTQDAHASIQATDYFQKAINLGNHNASIALARLHLTQHHFTAEDVTRLRQAASHHLQDAALLLGDIYLQAEWYNKEEAITFYRQAALLGSQSAMLRLGLLLKDNSWLTKAQYAVLCDEDSLIDAADYLILKQQPASATSYLKAAVKRGSPKAMRRDTELSLLLHGLGISPAISAEKIVQQLALAASLGDKTTQHSLPLFQAISP